MDKTLFYAREKLAASDINQFVTDVEEYGQDIITKQIYGQNTTSGDYGFDGFFNGLIASAVGGPNFNTVDISAGLAYLADGKKVYVSTGFSKIWDGTDGDLAEPFWDRIDVIAISHAYDSTTEARFFIDINPSSPTYGQVVGQNVVVAQEDYYHCYIVKGTPDAVNPTPPTLPSGYIPIAYVYIRNAIAVGLPIKIENGPTGYSYAANWDPTIDGDINNLYYWTNITSSKNPTFRWFKNGKFYSTGTTDGSGNIIEVISPLADMYSFDLIVDNGSNDWIKVNSINFNAGIVNSATGVNNATYHLFIRGV